MFRQGSVPSGEGLEAGCLELRAGFSLRRVIRERPHQHTEDVLCWPRRQNNPEAFFLRTLATVPRRRASRGGLKKYCPAQARTEPLRLWRRGRASPVPSSATAAGAAYRSSLRPPPGRRGLASGKPLDWAWWLVQGLRPALGVTSLRRGVPSQHISHGEEDRIRMSTIKKTLSNCLLPAPFRTRHPRFWP